MNRIRLTISTLGLALLCSSMVRGQDNSATSPKPNENGAATFYYSVGTSFGFPADQAIVITNQGSIASPKKTVLPNLGVGATIRAWRYIVPFVDLNVIDTGKATAQVGAAQAQ